MENATQHVMHLNPPKLSILPKYHLYIKIQFLPYRKPTGLLAETDRLCWFGNNCCYSNKSNETSNCILWGKAEFNSTVQQSSYCKGC
jgi:hypothetical protein